MNRSLIIRIGLVLTMSLVFAGCQSGNVQQAASTQEVQSAVPNTPYTKGPTTPPGVKGPSKPFPSADGISPLTQQNQPQAMTETETKKFTLN